MSVDARGTLDAELDDSTILDDVYVVCVVSGLIGFASPVSDEICFCVISTRTGQPEESRLYKKLNQ